MNLSDIPLNPNQKMLRQFAAAWLVFFSAFGAHQYFKHGHHQAGLAIVIIAVVVGVSGLIWPSSLRWLFVGWIVLAFPIGWVISQAMLFLMFFCIITPVAILFRLRGRDLLARKPDRSRASWWVLKAAPRDVRSYFKQY